RKFPAPPSLADFSSRATSFIKSSNQARPDWHASAATIVPLWKQASRTSVKRSAQCVQLSVRCAPSASKNDILGGERHERHHQSSGFAGRKAHGKARARTFQND